MKILAQIDTSRGENGNHINEVWSLFDVFGSKLCIQIISKRIYDNDYRFVYQYTLPEMELDHPEILQQLLDLL